MRVLFQFGTIEIFVQIELFKKITGDRRWTDLHLDCRLSANQRTTSPTVWRCGKETWYYTIFRASPWERYQDPPEFRV